MVKVSMSERRYLIRVGDSAVELRPGGEAVSLPTITIDPDELTLEDGMAANNLWEHRLEISMCLDDDTRAEFTKWLRENVTLNDKFYNSVGGHDAGHGRRPGAMRLMEYVEQMFMEKLRSDHYNEWVEAAIELARDRWDVDWQDVADRAVEKLLNMHADDIGEWVVDRVSDWLQQDHADLEGLSDIVCDEFSFDDLTAWIENSELRMDVLNDCEARIDEIWPNIHEVLI